MIPMIPQPCPVAATLIADALHARIGEQFVYRGMCDASAAAAIGDEV